VAASDAAEKSCNVGAQYGCVGPPVPADILDPTRSGLVAVSRVGSGMGTMSMGTGIPGFTRKEHDFS